MHGAIIEFNQAVLQRRVRDTAERLCTVRTYYTCITLLPRRTFVRPLHFVRRSYLMHVFCFTTMDRSEERRVGKECW